MFERLVKKNVATKLYYGPIRAYVLIRSYVSLRIGAVTADKYN